MHFYLLSKARAEENSRWEWGVEGRVVGGEAVGWRFKTGWPAGRLGICLQPWPQGPCPEMPGSYPVAKSLPGLASLLGGAGGWGEPQDTGPEGLRVAIAEPVEQDFQGG